MEYRKELSEKSKKLIEKQFKSDILNKSTGYYEKENIFPITSKPNEKKIKLEQFIPHFTEVKASERRFNNLLSDKQRNNSFIIKNKKLEPNKNPELELIRKRAKTIKNSCYDEKGNFSSKRRYILEFYGIEKLNELNKDEPNLNTENTINNIKTVKNNIEIDKDIKEYNENKGKEENIYNNENNERGKVNIRNNNDIKSFNNIKRKRIRDLVLKSRNMNNDNNYNIANDKEYYSYINPNYERFNTVNEEKENLLTFNELKNDDKNEELFNNIEEKQLNKFSRNKNPINYNLNLSTLTNKVMENTVANIGNPYKIHNRIKTDIHLPSPFSYINNTTQINPKYHAKDISKLFYTKTDFPVKNIRTKKIVKNNEDKELYNIEFKINKKNQNEDLSTTDKMNIKNIKQIFHNNGLHIYDFNEDAMNMLSTEKKIEAKLRKNKGDINFDKNYKNALKILEKNGIKANQNQILNEKGFQSKIPKKKRRATPGTVLYDNRFHKDENTKINTGNKNKKTNKKSKMILPQYDINYKNQFKYKEKYFNHKKNK